MLNNNCLMTLAATVFACMVLIAGAPAAHADHHMEDGVAVEDVTSEEIIFIEEEGDSTAEVEEAPFMDDMIMQDVAAADPIVRCREQTYTQGALLHCLENHMKDSEASYRRASETAQRRAHDIEDAQINRTAVRAYSSSSLAFESFRESECRRQKSLVPDEMEAQFTYMACVASLYDAQAQILTNP